jgi:glycosyltransferase involved in cell wall biosynthesis
VSRSARPASGHQLWVWYAPFQLGGVESYLLNMARETIAAGGKISIAAISNADGPLRAEFLATGARLLDWTAFSRAFSAQEPSTAIRSQIAMDLGEAQPDVIALNDCNDFSIGAAPLLRRVRPFCTIVDTFHIDSPAAEYLEFRQIFLDVLDGIATTNESVASRFRDRYPSSAPLSVRYIPNGATAAVGERRSADETLQLLYVGRLAQDQKRVLELPWLFDRLRASGKKFAATIVGDGPCRDALELEFANRGLAARVRLTGYLGPAEVQALLMEHDVLLNVSQFEGFSMSVLEAFAAGCVPVCTSVASLDRTAFVDGVNCRLFPTGELERLVDILRELTPVQLHAMSQEARATGGRFTSRHTYSRYQDFFRELRAKRPLLPWPENPAAALHMEWDLARHNPWLPKRRPLRRWIRFAWARMLTPGREVRP